MHSLREKVKEQLAIAEETAAARIVDKIFNYASIEEIDEIIIGSIGDKGEIKFLEIGEVKEKLSLTKKLRGIIAQAIKDMAGISSTESQGHFKKESLGKKIVFSVKIYNSGKEEKLVIHISKNKVFPLPISHLGGEKRSLEKIKNILARARGLVVVTGPFNSGKTGTLYSFLNYLNKPELNISTIENEISFDLPEINQTRFDRRLGFNHSTLFSSILRQDPDVVMIDEIVDREAAESALNLSLQGYFVLAGIHGQNIFSCLDFLQGLGINLKLLAKAVKLFINQRVIPKNCPHCLAKQKLTKASLEKIKKYFGQKFLERLKIEKIIPVSVKKWEDVSFYHGRGCHSCHGTGRSGSIGILEILEMDKEVEEKIRGGHLSVIKNEIKKQGNFTLAEETLAKASRGLTVVEEALKLV